MTTSQHNPLERGLAPSIPLFEAAGVSELQDLFILTDEVCFDVCFSFFQDLDQVKLNVVMNRKFKGAVEAYRSSTARPRFLHAKRK